MSVEIARARAKDTGRNDTCPCGSGKKYKKCHLAEDQAAIAADLDEKARQVAAKAAAEAEAEAEAAEGDTKGEGGKGKASAKPRNRPSLGTLPGKTGRSQTPKVQNLPRRKAV